MVTKMQVHKMPIRNNRRRGVATLEMVMCFPILIILVAMIFTIGTATSTKTQVTMAVRHEAWQARLRPMNPQAFNLLNAHAAGESVEEESKSFRKYTNLFPGISRTAASENVVLTGSWDHKQVTFAGPGFSPIYPHFGVLTQMVSMGRINTGGGNVGGLGQLTGMPMR